MANFIILTIETFSEERKRKVYFNLDSIQFNVDYTDKYPDGLVAVENIHTGKITPIKETMKEIEEIIKKIFEHAR